MAIMARSNNFTHHETCQNPEKGVSQASKPKPESESCSRSQIKVFEQVVLGSFGQQTRVADMREMKATKLMDYFTRK
jgi:hypothetical protein